MFTSPPQDAQELRDAKIVPLRQRIMPHHRTLLAKWLEAGRRMGLCDASAFSPVRGETQSDYVLIWVRENADPAYMVTPEGMLWVVTDCLRQHTLARLGTFEAALHFIRPVLPRSVAA
jgi:hypothetical protein